MRPAVHAGDRPGSRRLGAMSEAAPAGAEMATRYDPQEVEPRWAETWVERGYFTADPHSGKDPYCIVIPPPNVTGRLHVGHALGRTLEDTLIRRARMQGFEALWVPGHRSRRDRHAGRRRAEAPRGRHRAPRPGPRGLRRARLGVEGAVRRRDRRADQADGRLPRLDARAVHDGRGALAGRARRVRPAVRGRPDLPGRASRELVPDRPHGPQRLRGGARRGRRRARDVPLPAR